jgi:hypothetical protein
LKLSIGMPYYQGGHNIWLKIVWPSAQILLKTSSHLCQDSQLNLSHLLLSWWVRQCCTWREVVPHPSTAALKWPLGGRGYLYLSLSFTMALSSSPMAQTDEKQTRALSLFLHWHTLSSQATPLISPSILERKGAKTRLESSSTDFQS